MSLLYLLYFTHLFGKTYKPKILFVKKKNYIQLKTELFLLLLLFHVCDESIKKAPIIQKSPIIQNAPMIQKSPIIQNATIIQKSSIIQKSPQRAKKSLNRKPKPSAGARSKMMTYFWWLYSHGIMSWNKNKKLISPFNLNHPKSIPELIDYHIRLLRYDGKNSQNRDEFSYMT